MKKIERLLSIALASAILVGMTCFHSEVAAEEYVSKAKVQTLYEAPLQGVEGKEIVVKHFELPPKFVGGKHMHPGPVFVYVLKGELTVELENGARTYKTGELYPEEINTAMVGKNISGTDDLEILVFQVGDIGKPIMIKVK